MEAQLLAGSPRNFEWMMGHLLRNFWQAKGTDLVRSRNYDVISGTTSDRFFNKIVFSASWRVAVD